LILKDGNGLTMWSTFLTSFPSTLTISLLNNDNLMINTTSSETIWQSFDSPTDTLLLEQPVRKGTEVVSTMVRGGISSGYYLFFYNDNVLSLLYDGPEISSTYWPSSYLGVFAVGHNSYNSTRLEILDKTGHFIFSDGLSISASDLGHGIRHILTVDYDGKLRIYSLNTSDGTWEVVWEAIEEICYVPRLYGENATCEYLPHLMCSCLPGYEMNDQSN
jgi:D-mannose binding lectin/S-locus glycoprotein domain